MSNFIRDTSWTTIDKIGELKIEEYLVVGNEPILFTCRCDNSFIRYLVMLYDGDDFEYVISPIRPHDLADMLENALPMVDAFRKYGTIYFTSGQYDNNQTQVFCSDSFPPELLPKPGEKYDLKFDYIDRYIKLLRHEPIDVLEYSLGNKIWSKSFNLPYSLVKKEIITENSCFIQTDSGNNVASEYSNHAA